MQFSVFMQPVSGGCPLKVGIIKLFYYEGYSQAKVDKYWIKLSMISRIIKPQTEVCEAERAILRARRAKRTKSVIAVRNSVILKSQSSRVKCAEKYRPAKFANT